MINLTAKELKIFNNLSRVQSPSVSLGARIQEIITGIPSTEGTPVNAVKATGVLTIATQPIAADTMTIGTKLYTFVAVDTEAVDGDISVGLDLAGARLAIVAAINGTDTINTPHTLVNAGAFVGAACTITALVGGVLGNAIVTTEVLTAVTNVFAAGVLSNGVNGTVAVSGTVMVDGTYFYVATAENTVADANWRRIAVGAVY